MIKVKDFLDKGTEECPRLCYISEEDLLTVMCNRGDPVPIIPIISRIFPAISNIRFTEVMPSKNTLSLATTTGATNTDDEGTFARSCIKNSKKKFFN